MYWTLLFTADDNVTADGKSIYVLWLTRVDEKKVSLDRQLARRSKTAGKSIKRHIVPKMSSPKKMRSIFGILRRSSGSHIRNETRTKPKIKQIPANFKTETYN
jgi:hypothetical protein